MIQKLLLPIMSSWLIGIGSFLYFGYLPSKVILLPAIFIFALVLSLALPVAILLWDENKGFRTPGLFWLVINTIGAYLVAGTLLTSPATLLWVLGIALLGIAAGIVIPLLVLKSNQASPNPPAPEELGKMTVSKQV